MSIFTVQEEKKEGLGNIEHDRLSATTTGNIVQDRLSATAASIVTEGLGSGEQDRAEVFFLKGVPPSDCCWKYRCKIG